jgi:hypothetical protein
VLMVRTVGEISGERNSKLRACSNKLTRIINILTDCMTFTLFFVLFVEKNI